MYIKAFDDAVGPNAHVVLAQAENETPKTYQVSNYFIYFHTSPEQGTPGTMTYRPSYTHAYYLDRSDLPDSFTPEDFAKLVHEGAAEQREEGFINLKTPYQVNFREGGLPTIASENTKIDVTKQTVAPPSSFPMPYDKVLITSISRDRHAAIVHFLGEDNENITDFFGKPAMATVRTSQLDIGTDINIIPGAQPLVREVPLNLHPDVPKDVEGIVDQYRTDNPNVKLGGVVWPVDPAHVKAALNFNPAMPVINPKAGVPI